MGRLVPLALAALLPAFGACTPMRWEHPQLGAATDDEVRDCSVKARQQAWRNSFMYQPWGYPFPYRSYAYRDRHGHLRYAEPVFPHYRDTTFDEWNLRDYCMRSKGYQLVPVPEQASAH